MTEQHVPIPGSERPVAPAARSAQTQPVDSGAQIEATLVLRRRAPLEQPAPGAAPLSPAELAERFGAAPQDVDLVRTTLTDAGIDVVDVDPASRRIRVAGPVARMEQVFRTELTTPADPDPDPDPDPDRAAIRRRSGPLSVPAELDGVVTAVLGLDNRPQANTRSRVARAEAQTRSYTPVQLSTIYAMPEGTDGSGQTVAIVELGGGFAQSDLDTYFTGLGLSSPTVTAVGVDGAENAPGQDPNGADGEVLLDIEVVGGIAPKADIVVYFAPNTDAGFLDAITTAAHANPTPAAISISWGQSEDEWTAQARTAMDDAFADATAMGVTVTAAAGDSGSADSAGSGSGSGSGSAGVHVDFPAASPHALACGGTRLEADPATGTVTSETVWNEGASGGSTGGGVSDTFPVPSWQTGAGVPERSGGGTGRGVPDIAAVADPQTGYQVYVDGQATVIGGTSAVAPLWAGLVARLAQSLGRPLGLLQPALYAGAKPQVSPDGLRDITEGDNGAYSAGPGWDACTGLGVPNGTALLEVLRAMST